MIKGHGESLNRHAESDDAIRIDRITFKNYKFFFGEYTLNIDNENLLLYGENGSGKSSIYKALELLTQKRFNNFHEYHNIFSKNSDAFVQFTFNNHAELKISSDLETIPEKFDFLTGLSIFSPLLDYKKLLKVHYSQGINGEDINLYTMFRYLLKDYPTEKGKLSEYKDLNDYFSALKNILIHDLLSDINLFLRDYFDADIDLIAFETKIEIDSETDKAIPVVNLKINYRQKSIASYHTFLNEARLSALAISIYFVSIRKLYQTLKPNSLKMIVLDDLLISLDMSNRLNVLKILENEFDDFQIFFFTHDKALFELYSHKMSWKKYELYLNNNDEIPTIIVKQGKSEIERAKEHYAKKDYDCCALQLRKGFESFLKKYLTPKEQRNKNCDPLDLAALVEKAISKSSGEMKTILEKLNSDRKHILNPLSHNDLRPIYSHELERAMIDFQRIEVLITIN
ncbi:MAG: hypothetical protein OMM_03378 [Candidatus Magnetoglobus multicellularis str. Araruama]|uniref:RecF/RecN/SMC N-terminal domain-containing protein n=1 Tax=Candidatus Magnetoglobus multicellularis str. Araruama TaxID=890399 RepID=A0A1V1P656_9BACT|nr:MAG: hypothetical protein OMM_03378 [Candidatus Magnetoglobus multicellularis str. Araruama]